MHFPKLEQDHTGDAEFPSHGSMFAAHLPRLKVVCGGVRGATAGTWGLCITTAAPVLSDTEQLPGWAELVGEGKDDVSP